MSLEMYRIPNWLSTVLHKFLHKPERTSVSNFETGVLRLCGLWTQFLDVFLHQAGWHEAGRIGDLKILKSYKDCMVYFGCGPLQVTVTTRIITFLEGDSYKPSFTTGIGATPKVYLPFIQNQPSMVGNRSTIPWELLTSRLLTLVDLCPWQIPRKSLN